ncbi:hypothetical protein scyTo_0005603 [Scyliorhinus torazame]|uniref:Ig-like domain-containing protein n=1 Tax=Scyliorhinus torazame TaxID=75743 RepID=A0A401PAA1_SCYTO|nr:hypothetical protein [Scyliorhinus torazame]
MTEPSLKHTLSVIFLIVSFRGQVESGQPQYATSEPNIPMGNGKHLETIHLSGNSGNYGEHKPQTMDPITEIADNEAKMLNIPWPSETIPSDNRIPLLVEQKITTNQKKEQLLSGTNSDGRSSRLTPKTVNITKVTKIVLSCNLTLPVAQTPPITVPPIWTKNEKEIRSDGDHVNLTCKSGQYIPLYWIWSKEVKGSKVALCNETGDQFYIHSNGNKSSLLIKSLIMDNTTYYHCDAVYEVGFSSLRIHLKVNSLHAAIIPFVCIVAEVLVLVIFILACERRMKQKDDLAEGEIFPEKLAAEELIDSAENGARHRKIEPASVQELQS